MCADWPEPTPLPSGLLPVPKIDPLMLPEKLAPWLEDTSDRMQVPLDFAAVSAMVVYGSVIGCKVGVRPKQQDDWTEVCNLWGLIIARPGFMKSPTVSEILRAAYHAAEIAAETHAALKKEYEYEREVHKKKRADAVR